MQLLMLSGNSLRNRDWVHDVQTQIADLFDSTCIQEYKHWKTGDEWIDLPHELSVLRQRELQEPYGVFAKSIGTVLAVQAIQQGIIKPKFLLFCGIPLDFIIANFSQFSYELKACKMPIILVHNEHDTIGSARALQNYMGDLPPNITLLVTPGDTHDYEDYGLLKSKLIKLQDAV